MVKKRQNQGVLVSTISTLQQYTSRISFPSLPTFTDDSLELNIHKYWLYNNTAPTPTHDSHVTTRKSLPIRYVAIEDTITLRIAHPVFDCHYWLVIHVRAHLHQVSVSMLQELCNDASDTVLIENNGVASEWVATPFWSDSIVFNENSVANTIPELSQCCHWHLV